MAARTPADVIGNPERHRFELPLDGGDVAAAYYKPDGDGHLILTHTAVPPAHEGKGYASILARGVFDMARKRGIQYVVKRPYMTAWYAKHPDYADVVFSL